MEHYICIDCADLFGTQDKKPGMGLHQSTCAICGKEKMVAAARYDFGISQEQVEEIITFIHKMQDESTRRGWMML